MQNTKHAPLDSNLGPPSIQAMGVNGTTVLSPKRDRTILWRKFRHKYFYDMAIGGLRGEVSMDGLNEKLTVKKFCSIFVDNIN